MNNLYERNKVVEDNMGLVHMVARKFCGRGVDYEDIVQIGSIGLIKASERFSAEFNAKFSTYAVTLIMGEIKRFFRDDGIVKIPRKLKEIGNKISKVTEEVRRSSQRDPTINELSVLVAVDTESIVEAIDAMRPCKSLFDHNENNVFLYETIADDKEINGGVEDKILIKELIGNLDSRLRQIVVLRFFKDKTQSDVASVLKISQVQVSRLEKRALQILRNMCKYDI